MFCSSFNDCNYPFVNEDNDPLQLPTQVITPLPHGGG